MGHLSFALPGQSLVLCRLTSSEVARLTLTYWRNVNGLVKMFASPFRVLARHAPNIANVDGYSVDGWKICPENTNAEVKI